MLSRSTASASSSWRITLLLASTMMSPPGWSRRSVTTWAGGSDVTVVFGRLPSVMLLENTTFCTEVNQREKVRSRRSADSSSATDGQ